MKYISLILFSTIAFFACQTNQNNNQSETVGNNAPPSDKEALIIADEVMNAMGGLDNWNNTRYISWDFFGRRRHIWDKQTGNIRIESDMDSTIWVMNVEDLTGRVRIGKTEITDTTELNPLLKKGKSLWINDSYWLVMPFKLKDPGVTLKYLGQSLTQDSTEADILELTFTEVGDTPNNKYHVMVDKETRAVCEWSFFALYGETEPRFTMPWKDYNQYGNIMLSGDRGRAKLTDISVDTEMPETVFTQFENIGLRKSLIKE